MTSSEPRPRRRAGLAVALTGALVSVFLAGCSEDLLNPDGITAILGRALHTGSEVPVFDVGIGLLYHPRAVESAPAPSAQAVRVAAPYPNPMAGDAVTLGVVLEEPWEGSLRITSFSRDWPGVLAEFGSEGLPAGTSTFTWDGRDQLNQQLLPNGIYRVDLVDAEGAMVERQNLLLNRSPAEVIVRKIFHVYSGPDGDFRISDVAVGVAFTATGESGASLGERVLDDRVTLFADDIDFQFQETRVDIAPRQVVTVDLYLVPRAAPDGVALTPLSRE